MTYPVLVRVTLATTNTESMVRFYNEVFDATLQPVPAFGTTLYRGSLAGTELQICSNEIAGVDARQNRHQFHYVVVDIEAIRKRVLASGGTLDNPGETEPTSLTVRDPDGNSIVFVAE